MNKEDFFQQVALFRYSLIAAAITDTYEAPSLAQHFRNVAAKQHRYPDGNYVRVTFHSLERWLYMYKKHGLVGITPKHRADMGRNRALPNEAIEQMYILREKFPYITGKAIYIKLIEEGFIDAHKTSLSTVQRYIKNHDLKPALTSTNAVKSFEMEFANDCWQADTSRGPVIKLKGGKIQTFLISFIDDASRMIVHSQFYLNDNAVNMQDSFKQAIKKFGVPKKLFVDNGASYDNLQLQLICASLGVVLLHAAPFRGESKGKIERMFKTIKEGWMHSTDWNTFSCLSDIDASLGKYLSEYYTNHIHSSLNCTPKERFMRDYEKIRHIPADQIDLHFLHRQQCRVSNAATIKLKGFEYETPQQFIGSKINVRYLPTDLSKLFIFSTDHKLLHTIYPVKKVDNSKIKRTSIDYTQGDL